MQLEYIINQPGNSRLVIFFTGWSTNHHISGLFDTPEGYDLLVCWDYRKPEWSKLNKAYEEVVIFAWSFGVAIVEELYLVLSEELRITGTYAINGSRFPVNDEYGIPEFIFHETLRNLNEKNLQKFKIRIAGGVRDYNRLEPYLKTELSITELKEELKVFGGFQKSNSRRVLWDCAFISTSDKIFPTRNLQNSWSDTPIHWLKEEEHLPDLANIIYKTVKDKSKIRKNFERSLSTYDDNAVIQKKLSERLIDSLEKHRRSYSNILELGSGSGYLSNLLNESFKPKEMVLMDLAPTCSIKNAKYINGDIEALIHLIAKESFDLVVSGSTMQWFHSPARILTAVYSILKEDGIMGITTFLPETYREITEITGTGLLYFSEKDWKLISTRCGFEILESTVENHEIKFSNIKEVFDHIRFTGVNTSGTRKNIKEMRKIISSYPTKEGKFYLTYQSLTLILKKNKKCRIFNRLGEL